MLGTEFEHLYLDRRVKIIGWNAYLTNTAVVLPANRAIVGYGLVLVRLDNGHTARYFPHDLEIIEEAA